MNSEPDPKRPNPTQPMDEPSPWVTMLLDIIGGKGYTRL